MAIHEELQMALRGNAMDNNTLFAIYKKHATGAGAD
jgi:hypothetical protein